MSEAIRRRLFSRGALMTARKTRIIASDASAIKRRRLARRRRGAPVGADGVRRDADGGRRPPSETPPTANCT